MSQGLGYDATLRIVRTALVAARGNAWGFQVRSRGAPKLLSRRAWQELCEIETLLVHALREVVRRELHAEPHTLLMRMHTGWRCLSVALMGERNVIVRLLREGVASPLETWRRDAPQLETSLWPFFVSRTQHLANVCALALDEPAPFPPLIWHPGQRGFQRR